MKAKWLAVLAACAFAGLVGSYYALDSEKNILDQAERMRLGGSYIELTNGVTHYQLTGPVHGRVVVLIHGGTVAGWIWEKQVEALAGAGYRVLQYDQFGRGFSDRPDVAYDRGLYVRQLIELVDKTGLPEKFDLIGVSFGGAIAVSFAATHADRVRTLTLISPLVSRFKVPTIFRMPIVGEFAARIIGIDMLVERLVALLEGVPDSAHYEERFVEQTTYAGFQRSLLSMVRSDALGDYGSEYRAVGRQTREALLIWGTADEEISRSMIDQARSSIPDLRFEPVEGAGHGIMLQRPEVVNDLVLGFLRDTNAHSTAPQ